jgi:hypothetical protein
MYVNINYDIGNDPKDAVEAWAGAGSSRAAQPPAACPASRPGGQRRL